jgi:cellulose synthase/poly-beta-1,6-N-acetylglucosamine synthase-like glycosyltransferase
VVVIGRNEGERLRRCLKSIRPQCDRIVYVDSGSEDDSVTFARSLGVEVVQLDTSIPFTAARARNEGLRRLRKLAPSVEFVQFVDGDCELVTGWIEVALRVFDEKPTATVVCGRVHERFRNATIYNRLCDMEWNTPVGEAEACGGIALMRVAAVEHAGYFDPGLICGEEADLCRRLRARGGVVLRIDADMTLHDAAMTRAIQWWRRSKRGGFGSADALYRLGSKASESDKQAVRGVIMWVAVLPVLFVIMLATTIFHGATGIALALIGAAFALLVAQTGRLAWSRVSERDEKLTDACLYALSLMASKLPKAAGMLRCRRLRRRGEMARIIEWR